MDEKQIAEEQEKKRKRLYHYAVFYLVIMTIQLTGIEGWGTSYFKLFFMCLSPFLLLSLPQIDVTAIFSGILFEGSLWLCSMISGIELEWTTRIYSLALVLTFCFYCSLLKSNAFSPESFTRYLHRMILLFSLMIPVQQLCALIGLRFSVLNIHGMPWGWKFPSLFIEPSHAARIMLVYVYAYLEMLRYGNKDAFNVGTAIRSDLLFFLLALYAMLSMGSATAYGALAVLLAVVLFYSKIGAKFVIAVLILAALPFLLEIEAVHRLFVTSAAAVTLDQSVVTHADVSAAARVNCLIGFLTNFTPGSPEFWVGGVSYATVGIISYYGFLTFLMQMQLLMRHAFRISGIEWLICFVFFAMTLGNVAYVWSAVLIWVTVKHFYGMRPDGRYCQKW